MTVHGTYPTYTLGKTGWVGSTQLHQPKCKCCGPDVADELLELLVKRAAGKKVPGVKLTLLGLVAHFQESGRGFAKPSLVNHMANHITVQKVSPGGMSVTPAPTRAGTTAAKIKRDEGSKRDQALREAVDAAEAQIEVPEGDMRGAHVGYLEKVVRIAAHVVEQFPERVTPEMGIRAAAEIAKMRQNDSRDALLDMLVQTAVASPGKVARVGQAAIVRELDTGEEAIDVDAVEVAAG